MKSKKIMILLFFDMILTLSFEFNFYLIPKCLKSVFQIVLKI